MAHLPPPHQLQHVQLKGYVILCNLMTMNEQNYDLHKEFMIHLFEHGGSYTDVFEI